MVYVYVQRHFPCLSPFVGGCPHCCDSPACSIGPCLCLSDARPRRVQPHLGVLCNPTLACCATPPWRAVQPHLGVLCTARRSMRRTCTVASTPKSFAGCCQRAALTLRLRRCRRERCRHTRECFERGGTRRHAAARGGTRWHAAARGGTRRHAVARGGARWHAMSSSLGLHRRHVPHSHRALQLHSH